MNDRVRTLSLRVRTRRTDAEAKRVATRFVSEVLGRLAEQIRAANPGRVVFIRTLRLNVRMLERALAISAEVDAVASELRSHVDELVTAASTTPAPSDDVVVFDDVASWRAAFVLAEPGDRSAWYFADLAARDEPGAVLGLPDRALAIATVDLLCARTATFEKALSNMSTPVLVAWVETLRALRGADTWSGHTAPRPHDDAVRASRDRLVRAVIAAARLVVGSRGPTPSAPFAPDERIAPASASAASETADAPEPSAARAAAETEAKRRAPPRPDLDDPLAWTSRPTAIARASYLVRLWLVLDVGQALFLAGLHEGTWFAHALARSAGLTSPADDALPAAIGGVHYEAEVPAVSPAKVDAVSVHVLASWMKAVAGWPFEPDATLSLSVESFEGHRFVVARGGRCAMVVTAFAITTIDEAKAAIARVVGLAPRNVQLRATHALFELDRSGRLMPFSQSVQPAKDEPATCAALLVEMVAGAALELYALRSGVAGSAIASTFAVPGAVLEDEENIVVEIDATAIDVGLRRAGLDMSPGWLPWRRKNMAIEFTGLETW